ncbi:hypothetical protein G9A89_011550 [Geosiphon pyriformis]|nr:hypothetical protein G9A89_011550 [Geosiphon pyriformis]
MGCFWNHDDHMITSSDKIPFYQPFYDLPSINQPKPSASWNERMVSNEIQKYCNHKPNQTCMKCNVANGLNMLGYSDCPQVQFANPNCKKTFLNSLELFPKKNSFLENPNIHPKISSIFEKGSQSGIFEEFVTLPLLDLNYPLYPSISALAMNQFPLVVPLSSSSIFDGKISKGNSDTTLKSDYFEDHSLS